QLLAQSRLGATAKADARVLAGPLSVELSSPPDQLLENVKKVTDLMARLGAEPPSLEQLEAAKSRLIASMGERLRNPATLADVILDIESYGLGRDYLLRYPERANAVTPAGIQAAAREYLRPQGLVIVVSGP